MQFAPLNEAEMRNSTEMSKEVTYLAICFLGKIFAFKYGHKFTFSLL